MPASNWAGNHCYRARTVHRPTSIEQVQEVVAAAPRVRVLGSRHSFTAIGDSDELLTLEALPADVTVDRAAGTVSLAGATTYGELAGALREQRMALANLASLPHISVAGAVATGTHRSGDRNGNLATAVAGVEIVRSDGELARFRRGDPDFDGVVVGLGALGAVTRVMLDVEPEFSVRQRVYEGLRWEAFYEHFDEITSSGYSVSAFTRWGETVEQVWVKRRDGDSADGELYGAVAARIERPPDPRTRSGQLHAAARRAGAVVRAPPALPARVHSEQRRGAAVRVPRPARSRDRRDRVDPRARPAGPEPRAGLGDPLDCG
jgi:alditol oxidase